MYERWGVTPPSHDEHGTVEEIREKMSPMEVTTWRLEGNELIGEGPHGRIRQTIPPNYILVGTNENGLPVLKKLV